MVMCMDIDIYFVDIEKFNYDKLIRLFKQYGIDNPSLKEFNYQDVSYMMGSNNFESYMECEKIGDKQTELSNNITEKFIRYMKRIIENKNNKFVYKYSCMKCDNEFYIYIFALYFAKYHSGFIYNSLKKDYEDITAIENSISIYY